MKPETAYTWTAGVVLQPRFIPRLSITADWYDIRLENAINTVDPQTEAQLCVDSPTLDNQYCAGITRQNGGATPGYITNFMVGPLNVANYHTAGLDVQVDYSLPTAKVGTFQLHVVGNYLDKLTYYPLPDSPQENLAYVAASGASGVSQTPKFQVTANLGWTMGHTTLGWRIEYYSGTYRTDRKTLAASPDYYAPEYLQLKARFVNNFYFSQDINDRFQFYGGIDNIFNQKPDFASQATPVSAVGRYIFMGAKLKLPNLFK